MGAQQYIGTVVARWMPKTARVRVPRIYENIRYGKKLKTHKDFQVHDEREITRIGDLVRIEHCKPKSATKRFKIEKILKKADEIEVKSDQATEKSMLTSLTGNPTKTSSTNSIANSIVNSTANSTADLTANPTFDSTMSPKISSTKTS